MARGRKRSKPQSANDGSRSSRSPLSSQASQVSRHECPLYSCSSSLGSKDALKRHLQGHFLSKEPELSEDMNHVIHQAGFTICTICNSALVTARRNRCNTSISSCRLSRVYTQSSCCGKSQAPASPACTEHSESSQVPYSPICTSSSSLVLAPESDMEPYPSRVPVSLDNLRPASDPATLITPIRQDPPTHSTSCSSSHVSQARSQGGFGGFERTPPPPPPPRQRIKVLHSAYVEVLRCRRAGSSLRRI